MKTKGFPHQKGFLSVLAVILILGILAVLGISFISLFAGRNSQTHQSANQPQAPTFSPTPTAHPSPTFPQLSPSPTIVTNQTDLTAGWKIASEDRSNISFNFKYPYDWDDPSEHCITPPNPNNFDLSPNCIKTVIFTDQLDQFSNDDGRDLVLTSESKLKVSGYDAKRQIYAISADDAIPDTYELWVYDGNRPFFLFLAWIGGGTDMQTGTAFVQTFDGMTSTLEFQRRQAM